jgi:type II secretory pathway component PulJ
MIEFLASLPCELQLLLGVVLLAVVLLVGFTVALLRESSRSVQRSEREAAERIAALDRQTQNLRLLKARFDPKPRQDKEIA